MSQEEDNNTREDHFSEKPEGIRDWINRPLTWKGFWVGALAFLLPGFVYFYFEALQYWPYSYTPRNVAKIEAHFRELSDAGWEVQIENCDIEFDYIDGSYEKLPAVVRVRASADDDWVEYAWKYEPADVEAYVGIIYGDDELDKAVIYHWILEPLNENALEIHQELGLPLPEDFELEGYDPEEPS